MVAFSPVECAEDKDILWKHVAKPPDGGVPYYVNIETGSSSLDPEPCVTTKRELQGKLQAMLLGSLSSRGVVVKPRKGHDGLRVAFFSREQVQSLLHEEDEEEEAEEVEEEREEGEGSSSSSALGKRGAVEWHRILTAIDTAAAFPATEEDVSSMDCECWQLSRVPKGVIIQPAYASLQTALLDNLGLNDSNVHGVWANEPLELKVHLIFGVIILATVKGFPVYVNATG